MVRITPVLGPFPLTTDSIAAVGDEAFIRTKLTAMSSHTSAWSDGRSPRSIIAIDTDAVQFARPVANWVFGADVNVCDRDRQRPASTHDTGEDPRIEDDQDYRAWRPFDSRSLAQDRRGLQLRAEGSRTNFRLKPEATRLIGLPQCHRGGNTPWIMNNSNSVCVLL